jgi:hypothetical protein
MKEDFVSGFPCMDSITDRFRLVTRVDIEI